MILLQMAFTIIIMFSIIITFCIMILPIKCFHYYVIMLQVIKLSINNDNHTYFNVSI